MLSQVTMTTGMVFGSGLILIVAAGVIVVIVALSRRLQRRSPSSQGEDWLSDPQ